MTDMTDAKNWQTERARYALGFVLALALTLVPFAWVAFAGPGAPVVVGLCAILQVAVQLRYFLHIDLQRKSREDLQLILFTTLILLIMIIGTIWVIANQSARMM